MQLTASSPSDVIILTGAPRERGQAHGRQARGKILANLETLRLGIEDLTARGRVWAYEAVLARNEAFAEREAPELLEEVQGIAEGAGVPYRELLMLNLPLYHVGRLLPLDCTQILLGPPATVDGKSYLAKTRDLDHSNLKHVILHRVYPDGRELMEVNAAGSITWPGSGINSDGLTISTSGIWSNRTVIDLDRASHAWLVINFHLLLRDSRSLDELEERLAAQPRVTGVNLVAADQKSAAVLETTVDSVRRHSVEEGVLVRTNHFFTPEFRHLSPTPDEAPSTFHRYDVAMAQIRAQYGKWDLPRLVQLLGHHDGYPQNSICRHSVNGDGADTLYASVATMPDGHMWTILDHPCKSPTVDQATMPKGLGSV